MRTVAKKYSITASYSIFNVHRNNRWEHTPIGNSDDPFRIILHKYASFYPNPKCNPKANRDSTSHCYPAATHNIPHSISPLRAAPY